MHTYNLSLPADLQLRLMLPYPVFDDASARILLGAYIPGAKFTFEPSDTPVLGVVFRQSDQQRVVRRARQVTMYDTWRGQASLLDFIHLAYTVCRNEWMRKDLYVVHSALVDDVLLVGHSGSGKTSLSLRRVAKGGKLFSGNKTLIRIEPETHQLLAVAGTHTITAKAGVARKHLPVIGDEKVDYVGRNAYLLDPQMYSVQPTTPIRRIALIQLNDGADSTTDLSPLSALHRLHPFFLDAVNGDAIVCGGKAVYPGKTPAGAQARLAHNLLPALQRLTSVRAVTGSMPYVETALEEKHE